MKRDSRKRRKRNFWWAWKEEMRRLWEEQHGKSWESSGRPPFPPEMLATWREFFHNFTGDWPEKHWAFGGRRFRPWHQGVDTFNPFVANLFSQGGGLLPLVVLRLLSEQPRYGNEIMTLITERTAGQWTANPGAIYPLMTELENRGLIEGQWEDPRKRTVRIYSLTEFGEQELNRVKAIVRPKLDEAIEVLQEIANDLNGDKGEEDEPAENITK